MVSSSTLAPPPPSAPVLDKPEPPAAFAPVPIPPPPGAVPVQAPAPPPVTETVIEAEMVEEEAGDEEVPFDACIFLDGRMQMWGIEMNDDGSVSLTADQVREIRTRLAWSPPA